MFPNESSLMGAENDLPSYLQQCTAMLHGNMCATEFLEEYGQNVYGLCNAYAQSANFSLETFETLETLRLVFYGVILHAVCLLGVIGNVAMLVVLRQREFCRSSSTVYLKVMMAFDTLYLLCNYFYYVLISGLSGLPWDLSPLPSYSRTYVAYVLSDLCRNVGVLLTVAATVERYIFIRHSMHACKLCTVRRARIVSALLVVTAMAFQVPRALTVRVSPESALPAVDNTTRCGSETVYVLANYYALIDEDSDIALEYVGMAAFMIVPLVVLSVMTGLLLNAISKANLLRRVLSKTTATQSLDVNINAVLLSVVITFILCSLPMLLISVVRESGEWSIPALSTPQGLAMYYISVIALNVNAAINVLLFCIFGKKFRRHFKKTFFSFGATIQQRSSSTSQTYAMTASLRRVTTRRAGSESPETSHTLLGGYPRNGASTNGESSYSPTRGSPVAVIRHSRSPLAGIECNSPII